MQSVPGQSLRELREVVVRRPPSPVTRVVVGVDGSVGAAAAVQWATAEACRLQAMLRIVSAWDQPDQPPPRSPAGDPARIAAVRVQKALARVLSQPHYPRRISCVTPKGAAGAALLNEAGDAGLLVLGATGAESAPGRTTRYCLRRGRGPLVCVSAAPSVLRLAALHGGCRGALRPSARRGRGPATTARARATISAIRRPTANERSVSERYP